MKVPIPRSERALGIRILSGSSVRKTASYSIPSPPRRLLTTRIAQRPMTPATTRNQASLLRNIKGGGRRLLGSSTVERIVHHPGKLVISTGIQFSRGKSAATLSGAPALLLRSLEPLPSSISSASFSTSTRPSQAALSTLFSSPSPQSTCAKLFVTAPLLGAITSGATQIPHSRIRNNKRHFSSSPELQLRKQRLSRVASFLLPPSPFSRVDSVDFSTDTVTVEKPPLKTQKFGYHVSVSFSAKSWKMEDPHTLTYSPYNNVCKNRKLSFFQRRRARVPSGQDAFFISSVQEQGGVAMGVADGVGGYLHSGIDSADFSHELCEIMACMAQSAPMKLMHPRTLLNAAYVKLIEDQEVPGGASTACIGIARPDGVLTVANLGDSGYIILRDGKVVYNSTPQTHAFNTPYQLSVVPPKLLEQSRTFGGDYLSDLPKDATVSTHNLVHGDVVVFATDGLWDNLATQQILQIVCQKMIDGKGWINGSGSLAEAEAPGTRGIHPSRNLAQLTEHDGTGLQTDIANAIAAKAKSMSLNTKVDGPFAKEVQKAMPLLWYSGGKKDDICVVCMIVAEPEEARKGSSSRPQAQSQSQSEGSEVKKAKTAANKNAETIVSAFKNLA